MKTNNIIQEKSYAFALKMVLFYKDSKHHSLPRSIMNQLLRSGTSIGANVEEAIGGQTKKDFASKISIAYKESRETYYWLRLMRDSELISQKIVEEYLTDCLELKRILASIVKTSFGKLEGIN